MAYSSYVAQVAGVVSAMDVVVQQERRALIQAGRYDEYKDFFSAWDDVHTTVGAVDLLAGGVVGVSKLSRVNFANSAKNFATAVKNTRNLPVKIANAWNDAWSIASRETIFLRKLENAGYAFLKNELHLMDDATKTKFVTSFADESLDVLKEFNENPSFITVWKNVTNATYNMPVGTFKTCQSVLDNHASHEYFGNLVKKVMDGNPPSNTEVVKVGVTHPSFDGTVFIGRNFKPGEAALQSEFLATGCHPVLRNRIAYLKFVRKFVTDDLGNVTNSGLANKLINTDDLMTVVRAGAPGVHGEIRALSDALYELEKTVQVTDQTLLEFDMFIRNWNNQVMPRCICCFHISKGVKVLEGR